MLYVHRLAHGARSSPSSFVRAKLVKQRLERLIEEIKVDVVALRVEVVLLALQLSRLDRGEYAGPECFVLGEPRAVGRVRLRGRRAC